MPEPSTPPRRRRTLDAQIPWSGTAHPPAAPAAALSVTGVAVAGEVLQPWIDGWWSLWRRSFCGVGDDSGRGGSERSADPLAVADQGNDGGAPAGAQRRLQVYQTDGGEIP